MRNHEQIALGSADSFWSYLLDQHRTDGNLNHNAYELAGLTAAFHAVQYYNETQHLKKRLEQRYSDWDDLTDLGESLLKVAETIPLESLSSDLAGYRRELQEKGERLKELKYEIEEVIREINAQSDDEDED